MWHGTTSRTTLAFLLCVCLTPTITQAIPFFYPWQTNTARFANPADNARVARLLEKSPSYLEPRAAFDYKGYTFDPCRVHKDCVSPRLCVRGDFAASCSGTVGCFCFQERTMLCTKCKQCELFPTELCVADPTHPSRGLCASNYTVQEGILSEVGCNRFPDITPAPDIPEGDGRDEGEDGTGKQKVPVPNAALDHSNDDERPTPTNKPSDDSTNGNKRNKGENDGDEAAPNCIDARLMAHLPRSQHVYREHRMASVLCDGDRSCATPGHMVVYLGRAMMMREYCASFVAGGCSRRVLHVNSPRFSKQLRVPSNSHGLEFTAFAARFESKLERHFLSMAVKMGL